MLLVRKNYNQISSGDKRERYRCPNGHYQKYDNRYNESGELQNLGHLSSSWDDMAQSIRDYFRKKPVRR